MPYLHDHNRNELEKARFEITACPKNLVKSRADITDDIAVIGIAVNSNH